MSDVIEHKERKLELLSGDLVQITGNDNHVMWRGEPLRDSLYQKFSFLPRAKPQVVYFIHHTRLERVVVWAKQGTEGDMTLQGVFPAREFENLGMAKPVHRLTWSSVHTVKRLHVSHLWDILSFRVMLAPGDTLQQTLRSALLVPGVVTFCDVAEAPRSVPEPSVRFVSPKVFLTLAALGLT